MAHTPENGLKYLFKMGKLGGIAVALGGSVTAVINHINAGASKEAGDMLTAAIKTGNTEMLAGVAGIGLGIYALAVIADVITAPR